MKLLLWMIALFVASGKVQTAHGADVAVYCHISSSDKMDGNDFDLELRGNDIFLNGAKEKAMNYVELGNGRFVFGPSSNDVFFLNLATGELSE